MSNPTSDKMKWIKITVDIFDDEKIRIIESLPDPDSIIVIWFKLLTLAGKCNNSGVLMLNERIAYTPQMLSTLFNRPINTINLALETFEQFGMIALEENGAISIPKWEKHQSIEQYEKSKELHRIRQQKYRERQKLISQGNRDVTLISRDALEVEVEREEEVVNTTTTPTLTEILSFANEKKINESIAENFYNHYEKNKWVDKNKTKITDWKNALVFWNKREWDKPSTPSISVDNNIKTIDCCYCGSSMMIKKLGASLFGGTCDNCGKYQECEND